MEISSKNDNYMILSLPLSTVATVNVDANDNIFKLISDLHSSVPAAQFCNSHLLYCRDINLLLFVTWMDSEITRVYQDASITSIVSLIHYVIRNSTLRRAAVATFLRRWDI